MTPVEFLAALEALIVDAQKLTNDTAFLTDLTAICTAAKVLIPSNTVQGFIRGAQADFGKLEAIFKKK